MRRRTSSPDMPGSTGRATTGAARAAAETKGPTGSFGIRSPDASAQQPADRRQQRGPGEGLAYYLKAFPRPGLTSVGRTLRSEEHTSELQSQFHLVCRL